MSRFENVAVICSNILKPSHSSYLPAYDDGTDSIPKRQNIKFRRQGITQKKAYNNLQFFASYTSSLHLLQTDISVVSFNCATSLVRPTRHLYVRFLNKVLRVGIRTGRDKFTR